MEGFKAQHKSAFEQWLNEKSAPKTVVRPEARSGIRSTSKKQTKTAKGKNKPIKKETARKAKKK